jgi:hypothetical protein
MAYTTMPAGQYPRAIQPVVKAVVVPMIKVPMPIQAVWGAIILPINPPTAEQRAPAIGPKNIPDSGVKAAVTEKVLPVPNIGMDGSMWPAATIAAQTATTAG